MLSTAWLGSSLTTTQCTKCTSGFVDDAMLSHNRPQSKTTRMSAMTLNVNYDLDIYELDLDTLKVNQYVINV